MILWLLFQFRLEEFPLFFLVQLNQITALFGTLLLSWSMLLVTRLNFLERIFGGLDKVYKAHKKASIWGMVMITMHVVFLATQRIPNFSSIIKIFFQIALSRLEIFAQGNWNSLDSCFHSYSFNSRKYYFLICS
jgi:predicted ferric reductase